MRRPLATLAIVTALMGSVGAAFGAPAGILTADETGEAPRFVDPIVNPGGPSSHEHCFFGVREVDTTETSDTLRGKPSTWDLPSNHTAMWIPCPYEDGRLMHQFSRFGVLVYYKPVKGTEIAFPEDSGFVSGNARATTIAENPGLGTNTFGYRCNIGGGSFVANPEMLTCSGTSFVISIPFDTLRVPNWDPLFPKLQAYIRLDRGKSGPVGNITLGGPVEGVNGATSWVGLHGDYMPAHDTAWYERFLERCLRPGVACGKNPAL